MDIRSYLSSSTIPDSEQPSTSVAPNNSHCDSNSEEKSNIRVRDPVIVHLIVSIQRKIEVYCTKVLAPGGSIEKVEKISLGLNMILIVMVHSVNYPRRMEKRLLKEQVEYGQQGHSPT